MIEKNVAEFEKTNILKWHEAGYKGKGSTVVVLDNTYKPYPHTNVIDPFNDNIDKYGHKGQVAQVIREIAPDADIVVFSWFKSRKQEIVDWIKAHELEIDSINCSFHGAVSLDIYRQLKDVDIPVCVATGNNYSDKIQSIAAYDWTIAVGAWVESNDKKADYSNYGDNLDVVGYTNIWIPTDPVDRLIQFTGTSCATPTVSAMIAVYNSWRRANGLKKLTRSETFDFIRSNTIDKKDEGYDTYSGYGLFILPDAIPIIEKEEPEIIIPIEGDNKMKLVAISDGHGMETAGKRTPLLPNGMVMRENEFNSAVKRLLDAELKRCGFDTLLVAEGSFDVALTTRTNLANNAGADIYVSIHANAFDGVFNDSDPKGVETFHYPGSVEGKRLAESIHKYLIQGTSQTNRGVKSANFQEIRETNMPTVLIEAGFMDNLEEAMLLLDDNFRKEVAKEIAMGVCDYFGVAYIPLNDGIPIMSEPTASIAQMKAWAKGKNANQLLIDLAETFYNVSVEAGVNPVVTFCQSAKETGYMKFGGVLDASFKNPCGLKTASGGSDTSPSAHKRFDSWNEGITAQVDHLALYAGAGGYPKSNTPDPRHFPYLLGTAPTVESLGGKWAPSADYGESIVKMVKEVEAVVIEEPIEEPVSDLVDIIISLHGKPVVIKGIFKDGVNYIPIRFIENMGYKVDGIGSNVNIEYRE